MLCAPSPVYYNMKKLHISVDENTCEKSIGEIPGIAKLRIINIERSYYTRNNLDKQLPSSLNKAKFISRVQRDLKESIYIKKNTTN